MFSNNKYSVPLSWTSYTVVKTSYDCFKSVLNNSADSLVLVEFTTAKQHKLLVVSKEHLLLWDCQDTTCMDHLLENIPSFTKAGLEIRLGWLNQIYFPFSKSSLGKSLFLMGYLGLSCRQSVNSFQDGSTHSQAFSCIIFIFLLLCILHCFLCWFPTIILLFILYGWVTLCSSLSVLLDYWFTSSSSVSSVESLALFIIHNIFQSHSLCILTTYIFF